MNKDPKSRPVVPTRVDAPPQGKRSLTPEEEARILAKFWRNAPVDAPAPSSPEGGPHWIQVKRAFGGDPDHPATPAKLVSAKGDRVVVEYLGGGLGSFVIGQPERFHAVLGRPDLCLMAGSPVLLVNARYRALAVATGPAEVPTQVVVSYNIARMDEGGAVEVPSLTDGQPSWQIFTVTEAPVAAVKGLPAGHPFEGGMIIFGAKRPVPPKRPSPGEATPADAPSTALEPRGTQRREG